MPQLQTIQVAIPRSALKPDDFGLDANGNLKLDKEKLNQIVKQNINAPSLSDTEAVSVGVVVGT